MDRNQLEQILLNLAINGRDAMPNGGVMTITCERAAAGTTGRSDDVIVRVIDTGEGMPPEVVSRAFEPFFTTKSRTQGSGLGLATVYGIVRRSGGIATLESELGLGTEVTIRLPASTRLVASSTPAEPPTTGGHERIMLVEDEEPLRAGTARLLSEHGYDVVVAGDGSRRSTCSTAMGTPSSWS